MKNGELINSIAKTTQLNQEDCKEILRTAFHTISNALQKGHSVQIHGFGSFSTRSRNDNGHGQENAVDPVFSPGKAFREAVKKPAHGNRSAQKPATVKNSSK